MTRMIVLLLAGVKAPTEAVHISLETHAEVDGGMRMSVLTKL